MRHLTSAAAGLAAAFCVATTNALAQPADPAAYGVLPDVEEIQISPSGRYAAALQSHQGVTAVVFYDLDELGAAPTGVSVGEADARRIEWASDDWLLLLVSQSHRVETVSGLHPLEFFRWASISRSGRKTKYLFDNDPGYYVPSAGTLMSVLPKEPDKALFARFSTQARIGDEIQRRSRIRGDLGFGYALFQVNLRTGGEQRLESGSEYTVDWIVDENGDPVVRVDYDDKLQKRRIYARRDGSSQLALLTEFDEPRGADPYVSLFGLSKNPSAVLATTVAGRDKRALVEFNLSDGSIGRTLFSDPKNDIDTVVYDPRLARVTGVRYSDDLPRTFHLDPDDNELQADLVKALPGAGVIVVSTSADRQRMIVEAIYTDHPKQFFLFDRKARALTKIATSYSALEGPAVAHKEKYDYVASDGLPIPGYLTVPAGASKKNKPLIVLPHGGPAGRDDQSFDWWAFFYAARGYLVYQPNFRGSDGYGAAFRTAGYGEWGRKMQDDITEGVNHLVADGFADPARICIAGASYGGYAALAGATLTPDLYACAISVNGVSNLLSLLGEAAIEGEVAEDYWELRIGSRFRDRAELDAVSPVNRAQRARAPIMLIHGRDDTVAPYGQSQQMADALKNASKPHEFITLKGEDHWLSKGETRTEMLRRSIEFIDKTIGPNSTRAAN